MVNVGCWANDVHRFGRKESGMRTKNRWELRREANGLGRWNELVEDPVVDARVRFGRWGEDDRVGAVMARLRELGLAGLDGSSKKESGLGGWMNGSVSSAGGMIVGSSNTSGWTSFKSSSSRISFGSDTVGRLSSEDT